jgi:hypothetical protein
VAAHYGGQYGDVESLAMWASHCAYSKTLHFHRAYDEFAALDPSNERDASVINRQFTEEEKCN